MSYYDDNGLYTYYEEKRHLAQSAASLSEHAADPGHCQEFRDQCAREAPRVEQELAELRLRYPD